jgi:uroporphyrinogen-III decarboxylase
MTDRERLLACLLGNSVDRPPYWLFWSPWQRAWDRWRREGMPQKFTTYEDVRFHFGAEHTPMRVGVNCGP